MNETIWQEFGKDGRIVTRRRTFRTFELMQKFIYKLIEKDNFYKILAIR